MGMRAILEAAERASARCASCEGPAHEATGWVLQPDPLVMLCGRCAKDFAAWYKGRMSMMSITTSQQRKIAKQLGVEPESFAEVLKRSIKGDA